VDIESGLINPLSKKYPLALLQILFVPPISLIDGGK
jgi:hypothetical protein